MIANQMRIVLLTWIKVHFEANCVAVHKIDYLLSICYRLQVKPVDEVHHIISLMSRPQLGLNIC